MRRRIGERENRGNSKKMKRGIGEKSFAPIHRFTDSPAHSLYYYEGRG